MKKQQGKKFDNEKITMDLIPVIGLFLQGDVYLRGKNKYSSHNWRAGLAWSRILGAMFRHMLWFMAGESHDPDDHQHHLASVAWCANTLMEYEVTHPELDDRYIPFPPEVLRQILANMKGSPNVKKEPKKSTTKRPRNKKKHL